MQKSLSYLLIILLYFYAAHCHAERASLIVDISTNKILHAYKANLPSYPASLTKLMTLYLIFEAIDNNKLSFADQLRVSRSAQIQKGSRLGLKKGKTITVKELVLALIVRSANDAAVVAAEALAGNEKDFVDLMNSRAKILGLKETVFRNASGLPDPGQVTTARDMASLALAINQRFPHYFYLFSSKKFSYGKKTFKTHNHFTLNYSGAQGMKTGYTCNAGFNLVTLVQRGKQQFIGVILGEESKKERDKLMQVLMDHSLVKSKKDEKRYTLDSIRYQISQGASGDVNIKAIARSCIPWKLRKKPVLAILAE